MDPDRGSSETG